MPDNPVSKLLVAYERTGFRATTLDEVLDYASPLDGGSDGFPISGLWDLREALRVIDELYRHYPILEWRELNTDVGKRHHMWNEQVESRSYKRNLRFACHIKQDQREFKRGVAGEVVAQPAIATIPLSSLWRLEYLPKPGDYVVFRATPYEVGTVHIDPNHYWQGTAFPLYITCTLNVAPRDSRFMDCSIAYEEEEDGLPAPNEPGSLGAVTSTHEPD